MNASSFFSVISRQGESEVRAKDSASARTPVAVMRTTQSSLCGRGASVERKKGAGRDEKRAFGKIIMDQQTASNFPPPVGAQSSLGA